jgi:hypothetical protein
MIIFTMVGWIFSAMIAMAIVAGIIWCLGKCIEYWENVLVVLFFAGIVIYSLLQ